MDDVTYLREYPYIGLTGNKYIPYVKDGTWYVIPHRPTSFLNVVYLCRIPDEEATILKLKYGIQN